MATPGICLSPSDSPFTANASEGLTDDYATSAKENSCSLNPMYKRKFFFSEKPDHFSNVVCHSCCCENDHTTSRFPGNHAEKRVETENGLGVKMRSSVIDTLKDILIPLYKSLALVFCHLHGIPSPSEKITRNDIMEDVVLLLQPLTPPNIEERSAALYHYCTVFTAMRQWLESNHIHVNIFFCPPFSVSHAMIDLYRFLWYPMDMTSDYTENSCALQTRESHSWLISQDDPNDAVQLTIERTRIFLHRWYIKQVSQTRAHRTMEQCIRACSVLQSDIESASELIRQETREHLCRLLLLGHFSHFFEALALYSANGDLFAGMLRERLTEPNMSDVGLVWTTHLFDEKTHEYYLEHIRRHVRDLESSLDEEKVSGENIKETSVFSYCYEVLLGEESQVDWVIQQAFPNCWLSSFTLGLFWRTLNTSVLAPSLLDVFLNGPRDTGGTVAYFFNSWLEAHKSIQTMRHLKEEEVGLAALLSHDVNQLVEFLRAHSHYPCSPILMDLVSYDHSFFHSARLCSETFFSQKFHSSVPEDVKLIYLLRALMDSRAELLQRPIRLSSSSTSTSPVAPKKTRLSRYAFDGGDEQPKTPFCAKISHREGASSLDFSEALSPFVFTAHTDCYVRLASLYTTNYAWAGLALLFMELRTAHSYMWCIHLCELLDATITGQSVVVLEWISRHVIEQLKVIAEKLIVTNESPWEGLLVGLLCVVCTFDHLLLRMKETPALRKGCSHPCDLPCKTDMTQCRQATKNTTSCHSSLQETKEQCLLSWRHQLRWTGRAVIENMQPQSSSWLTILIAIPKDNDLNTPSNDITTSFVFHVPNWCHIPDMFVKDAVALLMTSRTYCPQLAFYQIVKMWNPTFAFIQDIARHPHTIQLTLKEQQDCQDAIYWLLKCIFQLVIVPRYVDTAINVIYDALVVDDCRSPKSSWSLFTMHQLQELEVFWTSYTTGMFDDVFRPPKSAVWSLGHQTSMYDQFNKILSRLQLNKIDLKEPRPPTSLGDWHGWVLLHF